LDEALRGAEREEPGGPVGEPAEQAIDQVRERERAEDHAALEQPVERVGVDVAGLDFVVRLHGLSARSPERFLGPPGRGTRRKRETARACAERTHLLAIFSGPQLLGSGSSRDGRGVVGTSGFEPRKRRGPTVAFPGITWE